MKTFKQWLRESHAAAFQGRFTKKLVDSKPFDKKDDEKKKEEPKKEEPKGLSDTQKRHLDAFRKKGVMHE